MQTRELTQAIKYRIDGLNGDHAAAAEYARWHYIDSDGDKARFVGPNDEERFLALDQLIVVGHGHLQYETQ